MKSFALQGYEDGNDDWRHASAPSSEPDYCSRDGAMALKTKIEAYWRDRGQNVMLSLHNVGFHPAIRAARYDVRSDMVNGMPRADLRAATKNNAAFTVSLVSEDEDNEIYIDD